MRLNDVPRIELTNLPTPLEEARRFGEKIGLSKLLIKRDDLTGLAGGGNKARKLEYDIVEILNGGYDVVITAGGIQSNHARMTAAAAKKFGLEIKLVLGGRDFIIPKGNLLLDIIFNAEIRFLVDDDENEHLTSTMEQWADELKIKGRKPFVVPIGGSTGLGALGYVKAIQELAEQLGNRKVQIILPVGSCGTIAGVILGTKIFMPNARVIGVSVSRPVEAIKNRTKEIIQESASLIDYKIITDDIEIECYDNYHIEYGIITPSGEKAILDFARLEGILLDPIYTGKTMAGLIDLSEKNMIDKSVLTVFIHTGGMPSIFSFETELGKNINCTKIYK